MDAELTGKIAAFERRLWELEEELVALKRAAAAAPSAVEPPAAEPEPEPLEHWWTDLPPIEPAPQPEAPAAPPARAPREPRHRAPEVDWADLLGARALAIAGGVVTVLGIVFFFALAVNRGWIGPGLRVTMGAAASALVFAGGIWLRRRFGETHASLAAVGAGIAGGYATLLFATARYDLVPEPAALVVAAAIAAVGVVTALAWSAEVVAGIGLVGAMVVPALAVADTGLTAVGTAFVVIVLAAAGVVGLTRGWSWLLVWTGVAALPQLAAFVADAERGDTTAVAIAAAFVAVSAAIGVGRHVRRGDGLDPLGTAFVAGAAGFAAISSLYLLDHTARGIALGILAAAYAAASAVFFRSRRDLATLLWAAALVLGADAAGELVSGLGLTLVWAAQGAGLAWLAARTGETRLRIGSVGYLALAAAHALLFDAPPHDLFAATADPAAGAPALVAVAAGLAVLARYSSGISRRSATVAGTVLVVDAASLCVLDVAQGRWGFDWGAVAVTGLWSGVALAAVVAGARLERLDVTLCGLAAFAAALLKALAPDQTLDAPQRWWTLLATGSAFVAAGFLYQLLARRLRTLDVFGVAMHATGLAVGVAGLVELVGSDRLGTALAFVSALYAVLAASVLRRPRQRDHASLLGAIALAAGIVAAAELLDGTVLVLVWAIGAVALALVARPLREPRFLVGSAVLVGLAIGEAFELAPVREFTSASSDPGNGVPALVLALAAGAVLARAARADVPSRDEQRSDGYEELAAGLRELENVSRPVGPWAAGVIGLYALSLAVLEAFERLSPGDVEQRFQHGHTAVSACWALVALGLLYAGLTRRSRALRLGGFVLFGAALAKLFLYDLAALSSITRALSFLAVGALLLLAGFFYQRLTEQLGLREPHAEL